MKTERKKERKRKVEENVNEGRIFRHPIRRRARCCASTEIEERRKSAFKRRITEVFEKYRSCPR